MQVRPTIEACAQSPWFLALPGSVRVHIIEDLVKQAARQMFWSRLDSAVWREDWAQARPRDMRPV